MCAAPILIRYSGKKIMSLAVTEPYAGSDVAGLLTTAVRERDGQTGEEFYVVNGLKKFITGGTRASYFTTAVRTSGPGMRGVSVLLIPAELEGVKATRMKTQGSQHRVGCAQWRGELHAGARTLTTHTPRTTCPLHSLCCALLVLPRSRFCLQLVDVVDCAGRLRQRARPRALPGRQGRRGLPLYYAKF